jgi:hypothetical protein
VHTYFLLGNFLGKFAAMGWRQNNFCGDEVETEQLEGDSGRYAGAGVADTFQFRRRTSPSGLRCCNNPLHNAGADADGATDLQHAIPPLRSLRMRASITGFTLRRPTRPGDIRSAAKNTLSPDWWSAPMIEIVTALLTFLSISVFLAHAFDVYRTG